MIATAALFQHLTRPEVSEVVLTSGRRPGARLTSGLQEIADEAISADDLLQILFATGGSRYVDALDAKPAQWRTRIDGVGAVVVSAAMSGDVIEAHYALRDTPIAAIPAAPPPLKPAMGAAPPNRPRAPSVPPRAPSAPPGRPKSARPRALDGGFRHEGVPSSRRPKAGRQARTAADGAAFRARTSADDPPTPRSPGEVVPDRPSDMPTPPRGTQVPRAAMPSNLELDLEIEIPSVPSPPARSESPFPAKSSAAPAPPQASAAPAPIAPTKPPARPQVPASPSVPPVVVTRVRPPTFDESPSSPMSPRTLPESGFGRDADGADGRLPAVLPDAEYGGLPPPTKPPPPLREPTRESLRDAVREVREHPQSFSLGLLQGAEARPSRHPGRTTRPFEREPHTSLFRKLLRSARELGASDLHLVAGRPPLLRLAGQVLPRGDALDPSVVEDLVLSRIPRRLHEVFERDGSCDFSIEEPELGRFRVNASRNRAGIKASLRLISLYVPTLAMLGLPEAISAATRHHQGLIVLTGPTGHGKTTTLAAVVDILNSESARHVITVEDPIEYIHPRKRAMLSQREVGTHTRSFQTALKAALREDPDVIVVGELRDTETVRIALEASETGHLVLGTMSTPSAAKAIDRLIDLFPPPDQSQVRMTLAGGLRLIVSQRLLPDAEGKTMVAAAEVLPGILPLWNLIRDNRTYQIPSLQQRGRELGVIRLDDSLRDLVRAGKVTPAAAVAVAESPDELEQSLGIRRTQSMGGMPAVPPPQGGRASSPVRIEPRPPEPAAPKGIFDRVFKKGG